MRENERPLGENESLSVREGVGKRVKELQDKERLYANKIDELIEQLQSGGFPKGRRRVAALELKIWTIRTTSITEIWTSCASVA